MPIRLGRPRAVLSAIALAVAFEGCGGTEPTPPAAAGSIHVTVSTTGAHIDADGYTLAVDGATRPIAVDGEATISDLAAGSHAVALTGMAVNCLLAGPNPREVVVASGQTSDAALTLTCSDEYLPRGTIRITTTTTGSGPDPNGYTVLLDGQQLAYVQTNATAQVDGVLAGEHDLTLSAVATNCTVQDGPVRHVTVVADGFVTTTFAVDCPAPPPAPGTVTVTFTTSGRDPDTDGYTVSIDGGAAQAVGANASFSTQVPAGSHSVTVGGAAANCAFLAPSPWSDWVYAGDTRTFAYSVRCVGPLAGRIVYTGRSSTNELFSVSPDGGEPEQITMQVGGGDYEQPSVSPDGTMIAYMGYSDGYPLWIHTMRWDASGHQRGPIGGMQPAWSPDGSRIAYTQADNTVWTMRADFSEQTQVSPAGSQAFHPGWSPDGARIVFGIEGGFGIVNLDGTGAVTRSLPWTPTWPRWSPDGTRILLSNGSYAGDLWTVQPDGSALTQLTTTGHSVHGEWSPDGMRIVYQAEGEIWTMRADGSDARKLATGSDAVWVR